MYVEIKEKPKINYKFETLTIGDVFYGDDVKEPLIKISENEKTSNAFNLDKGYSCRFERDAEVHKYSSFKFIGWE